MTVPMTPLVAHYTDSEGRRLLSLKIVALSLQGAMVVLFDNRLVPVFEITKNDPTLKLGSIEYLDPYVAPELKAASEVKAEKPLATEVVKPKKATASPASPVETPETK